jgi:uncharacterized protein YpmB
VKKKWKIWIAILAVIILSGGVYYGVKQSRADIVTVQTAGSSARTCPR